MSWSLQDSGYIVCNGPTFSVNGRSLFHTHSVKQEIYRVDLPVPNVTSCVFGGPDYKTLFITTATSGLTREQLKNAPLSGGLFRLDTEVCGLPPERFWGDCTLSPI